MAAPGAPPTCGMDKDRCLARNHGHILEEHSISGQNCNGFRDRSSNRQYRDLGCEPCPLAAGGIQLTPAGPGPTAATHDPANSEGASRRGWINRARRRGRASNPGVSRGEPPPLMVEPKARDSRAPDHTGTTPGQRIQSSTITCAYVSKVNLLLL